MHLDFPYGIDLSGRTARTGDADHVRDLIEQLLFTSPGERVNRPDFGSGLRQLVFAPASVDLAATLKFTLEAALVQFLGDQVELSGVEVAAEEARVRVEVHYRLTATGESRRDVFEREA